MSVYHLQFKGGLGSSNLLEELKLRPRMSINSFDDNVARALLFELGALSNVEQKIALAPNQGIFFRDDNQPTHWIFIAHFDGCMDKKENGFCVWCLPKALVSKSQMEQEFKDMVEGKYRPGDNWQN